MDIRQFRNVVAVADYKCFSKAAEKLGISQPALSMSVRGLEKEVGAEVFVRARKQVVPTEFGAQWIVHARSVLREVEKAQELAHSARADRTRVVRIGVDSMLAKSMAHSIIPRFSKLNPGVRVDLDVATGTVAEAFLKINSGAWDLGVVLGYPTEPTARGQLAQVCARLTTAPFARREHPLAGRRTVPVAELARQTWVLSTRGNNGARLAAACVRAGAKPPQVVSRINAFEVIKDLIESNDWVTFFPAEIVEREHRSRFARLHNPDLEFEAKVLLLRSEEPVMTAPARALYDLVSTFLLSGR